MRIYLFVFILLFFIKNNYKKRILINENIYLVSGLCIGYNKTQIEPFIKSLFKCSKNFDLLVFTNDKNDEQIKEFKYDNIISIKLLNIYPYYPSNDNNYPISESILLENIPDMRRKFKFFWHTMRYHLLSVWLNQYGSKYQKILFTDIRDVLFQKDLFNENYGNGVLLPLEPPVFRGSNKISSDSMNSVWIKPFKPSKEILDESIINSGVLYGTNPEMTKFIKEYSTFMIENNKYTAEQGALNYFYYSRKNNFSYSVKTCEFGTCFVLTYTYLPTVRKKCCYPKNYYLYNDDKTIPPVVHGFDRGLKKGVEDRIKAYKKYVQIRTDLNI